MDKQMVYFSIFIFIVSSIISVISFLRFGDAWDIVVLYILFVFIAILYRLHQWNTIDTFRTVGEQQFSTKFGVTPDNVEYMKESPPRHQLEKLGICGPVYQFRFFVKGKEYRGIVSKEEKILYIKDPIYLPVYDNDPIPVWKEVTKVYRSGIPKKIEYYDDMRALVRVDFFYEHGERKNNSWRRHRGILERWDAKTRQWVSQNHQ
ncbi:MAG: hypothetical protein HXS47_02270 [Theionarchaea archaeon]|nr:hypothetical protein [Theionarchaea archaeon]